MRNVETILAETLNALKNNKVVFVAVNDQFIQITFDNLHELEKFVEDENYQGLLISVNAVKDQTKKHAETNVLIDDNFVFAYDLDTQATQYLVERLIHNLEVLRNVKEAEIWLSASKRLHVYVKLTSLPSKDINVLKQFKVDLLRQILFANGEQIAWDLLGKLDKVKPLQWLVWAEGIYHPVKNSSSKLLARIENGKVTYFDKQEFGSLPKKPKFVGFLTWEELLNLTKVLKQTFGFECKQSSSTKSARRKTETPKPENHNTQPARRQTALRTEPTPAWFKFEARLNEWKKLQDNDLKKLYALKTLDTFVEYFENGFNFGEFTNDKAHSQRFLALIWPIRVMLETLISYFKEVLTDEDVSFYRTKVKEVLEKAFPDKTKDIEIVFSREIKPNENYFKFRFFNLVDILAGSLNSRHRAFKVVSLLKLLSPEELLQLSENYQEHKHKGLSKIVKGIASKIGKTIQTVYTWIKNFKSMLQNLQAEITKKANKQRFFRYLEILLSKFNLTKADSALETMIKIGTHIHKIAYTAINPLTKELVVKETVDQKTFDLIKTVLKNAYQFLGTKAFEAYEIYSIRINGKSYRLIELIKAS